MLVEYGESPWTVAVVALLFPNQTDEIPRQQKEVRSRRELKCPKEN